MLASLKSLGMIVSLALIGAVAAASSPVGAAPSGGPPPVGGLRPPNTSRNGATDSGYLATYTATIGNLEPATRAACGRRAATRRRPYRANVIDGCSSAAEHAARSTISNCKRNKAHGTVIYSDVQFPDTLSPEQTAVAATQETLDSMFAGAVYFDHDARLAPDMLTKVPTARNGGIKNRGRTYVFTLRHGMRWSNGQGITSADFKFGLAIDKDPVSGPVCAASCSVVARADTPNTYTIVYQLKHPDAAFLTDDHYGEIWPTVWPGGWRRGDAHGAALKLFADSLYNFEGPNYPTSGPYQVASRGFVAGNRITLHPMRYYNILSCGARVRNLIFSAYGGTKAMLSAAANHTSDVTQGYTLAHSHALVSHARQFRTIIQPAFTIEHLEFNHDAKFRGRKNPLASAYVRLALSLAVNKEALLRSVFSISARTARGVVAYDVLVNMPTFRQPYVDTSVNDQWDPLIQRYIQSGSRQAMRDAKKLLARAGYKHGFTLDFQTTSSPATRLVEQSAICADYGRIGVNCNPFRTSASQLFANWTEGGILDHGMFQVALFGYIGGPDPDALKSNLDCGFVDRRRRTHSSVNDNYAGICDRQIDQAFTAGDRTLNTGRRAHFYSIIQRRLDQNADWMLLYYRPEIGTTDGRVQHFSINPTQTGAEWNTWQWAVR